MSVVYAIEKDKKLVSWREKEREGYTKVDINDYLLVAGNYYRKDFDFTSIKSEFAALAEEELCSKCDVLSMKLQHNETYIGTSNYDSVKDGILKEIKETRILIGKIKSMTVEELMKII